MLLGEVRDRRTSTFHTLVVLLSFAMTIGAWLYSKNQVETQTRERFNAARDRTVDLIRDRMSRYEDALWSGVAHVDARQGSISIDDWRLFSDSLNIEDKYPGVNGIGVIEQVPRSELSEFLAERARENRDYHIFPDHGFDVLLPITVIEPEAANAAAVGLDIAHETNRRAALFASRDTGRSRITAPVVLVQDTGNTPGFLFYAPFYTGPPPVTPAERKARFSGVVYAPFVVRNLVAGLLSKDHRLVRFSLRDGDQVIYDEHDRDEPLHDANPMFTDTVELDMYGRKWTVEIKTNLAFRAQNGSDQSNLILAGGLIIEILVISLLIMLTRSRQKIHQHAQRLTRELHRKSEHLEQINAEIEQFVYIASHDLKTPTRGIGFLTDVIEEDLEELVGPLEDKGDFRLHFDMIRERVTRMNELTQGIMEFSRAGQNADDPEPDLPLRDLIGDCIADFEIAAHQLQLNTDIDVIRCDGHSFRRVLENLVGNAFKYHPNRPAAQVEVQVETLDDRLRVQVTDNGPGIAADDHEKIFNVFQTLKKGAEPESTGIGLAIVKKAVQRHGFDIHLVSEPGTGAQFTFHWPKQKPAILNLEDVA